MNATFERWSREAKERETALNSIVRLIEYPTPRGQRLCGSVVYCFQNGHWEDIGITCVAYDERGPFCNVPGHIHSREEIVA